MSSLKNGKLFIVSTPIGNLKDITQRAIDTLRSVEAVACEDTRRTGQLLSHLGFKKKLISYNDINAEIKVNLILSIIEKGLDIALVSDAGTPGISDPAYRLVKSAVEKEFEVLSIPGPSAVLGALVVSGFPLDKFVFEGFLPSKGAKRKKSILLLKYEHRTIILYEAPHRIKNLLELIHEILGDREISVSREMTKLYEETVRGKVSDIIEKMKPVKPRGEYTVVI
ncbi:MAG TPA: 16S rRNA (cytidine(1402)-2'-O)-methyltransferase, partial [bacterium]|nr:16S rRNA (cytidine(1402)-2'-O)-methyltransferase [bacterium]